MSHIRLDKLNILLNQSNLQGILVVGIHKPTQHGECQGRASSRDQPLNRTESHLRNRIGFSHMHTTLTWIIDPLLRMRPHWTRHPLVVTYTSNNQCATANYRRVDY